MTDLKVEKWWQTLNIIITTETDEDVHLEDAKGIAITHAREHFIGELWGEVDAERLNYNRVLVRLEY